MKPLLIATFTMLTAGAGQATTIRVVDPFGPSTQGNDVLGDPLEFDIQNATLISDPTTKTIAFTVNMNWGGTISGSQINSFTVSGVPATLNIGDLLLSIAGVAQYGVAMTTHSIGNETASVTAGHVYKIDNQSAVATAQQVLGLDPNVYGYRPTAPVWIHQNGGLTDMGNLATITTARNTISGVPTDGTNGAEWAISVAFSAISGGFGATDPFLSGAAIGFSFASATCGNDMITGATPEPETLVLAGGALVLFSLAGRKRRVSRSATLA